MGFRSDMARSFVTGIREIDADTGQFPIHERMMAPSPSRPSIGID